MTEIRTLHHRHDGTEFESLLVHDGSGRPRPAVLIFPTIMGRGENELDAAHRLVGLGYTAIACDLYGRAHIGKPREECAPLMNALRSDRPALRDRLLHLLETMRAQPEVDAAKVAAIGFCFGGLCALDLARSGADISGSASFHGLFKPPPETKRITAKVIAFHGWDDPLAPPEDVTALASELSEAGADWQILALGGVVHGFTNPKAANPEGGIVYDARAAARAWRACEDFLEECFA